MGLPAPQELGSGNRAGGEGWRGVRRPSGASSSWDEGLTLLSAPIPARSPAGPSRDAGSAGDPGGRRSPRRPASCKTGPGIPGAPRVWEQVTPQTARRLLESAPGGREAGWRLGSCLPGRRGRGVSLASQAATLPPDGACRGGTEDGGGTGKRPRRAWGVRRPCVKGTGPVENPPNPLATPTSLSHLLPSAAHHSPLAQCLTPQRGAPRGLS